ncbi:MAG: response regulator [Deltaproteobacteria bacterium]|nr:response regulator [Deltaproteobacteria bacterium]
MTGKRAEDEHDRTDAGTGRGRGARTGDRAGGRESPWLQLQRQVRAALKEIVEQGDELKRRAAEHGLGDLDAPIAQIEQSIHALVALVHERPVTDVTRPDSTCPELQVPSTDGTAITQPDRPGPQTAATVPAPPPDRSEPDGSPEAAATPAPAKPVVADEPDPASLLVVDDSELNREVLAQQLRERGYQVEVAASGAAALARVDRGGFDLILLDVMMPGLSGLEVLKILRQQHAPADLPVIMVTARDGAEDVVEALEAGANDFVTKATDLSVAQARVETQLALKRSKDDVEALNQRLVQAQGQIAELADAAADNMDQVSAWGTSIAAQVAEAIGADAVEVSLFEDGEASPPRNERATEELRDDLLTVAQTGRQLVRADYAVVPVRGPSYRTYGAAIVYGGTDSWTTADRQLIDGFARQLGGALELKGLRQKLATAAEQRRVRQEEMLDQGIDLLRTCPTCARCYDQSAERCTEDDTPLDPARSFPYRVAGRYRLVKVCAEGGMGTVYRAFDERLDRDVAVKVIKPEHFHDDAVRQRFEHEARAVARIDHPGVIAVFDSGELEDGSLFMVIEWLEGRDLGRLLHHLGPGKPDQVAELLRQGATALHAAHEAGLVHRDIKPDNLFLVPEGQSFKVKILDFGVAKEVKVDAGLTRTGALVGTPRFMAPEQFLQQPLDERCDLYSFAAVIYQAITGRRVALSNDFGDLVLEVIHEFPPPASELVPGLPKEVDEALQAALAKRPADRPASLLAWAAELAERLDALKTTAVGWLTDTGEIDLTARTLPPCATRTR